MADSEHSSSDETNCLNSQEVQSREHSNLEFSEDEEALVIRMYRWHLIAGRIPGRTEEEIEKYWNSRSVTGD